MGEMRCHTCDTRKPFDAFSFREKGKYRRENTCKQCRKERNAPTPKTLNEDAELKLMEGYF